MTDTGERETTDGGTRRTTAPRSRASGESSIFKGEDGRWHGFVSMGKKDNGRRDRRHVSGARRADVVTKVRAIEAKRRRRPGGSSRPPTHGQRMAGPLAGQHRGPQGPGADAGELSQHGAAA